MISLEDGVNLVDYAFNDMIREIYVKKIPLMKVTDVAKVCRPDKGEYRVRP